MNRFAFLPLGLCASPALAHSGAHLHPHGAGNWLTIVLALSVTGGAALVWSRATRARNEARKGRRK